MLLVGFVWMMEQSGGGLGALGTSAHYSKHLNRRDTHINQHSRQKMIQIKRETHVLINTAQKTVHNNLQHALNNRDTPNLATCLFYKDLEKNTTFLT